MLVDEKALVLTAGELAARLKVSTRTLWRKLSAKQILAPVRIGGLPRWPLDRVKQWIEDGCPEPGEA